MSYRTVKRVLGETSLELKCLLLFGISLSLLIFAAFFYTASVAEKLVLDKTRKTGRDYVDTVMIRYHWELWETDTDLREMVEEMGADLPYQNYDWTILGFDDDPGVDKPIGSFEEATMRKLQVDMALQLSERLAEEIVDEVGSPEVVSTDESEGETEQEELVQIEPVFASDRRRIGKEDYYLYYQPIYWKESCRLCHPMVDGINVGALSAADSGTLSGDDLPLRVVRISIPIRETQSAIARTRAVLTATGIFALFLAMLAFYLVVRYVIVKPLQHLRDVSEQISEGDMQVRASIESNDEFRELADSFNRMVRHLIDAQNKLRHVNVDLDAKVDLLAQANMKLYEMNRLKGDFLANMSHELRTPLNSIIGFSEVLQGIDTLDEKQKKYALNIQKSGRVLLEMINDILDLAKIESGKIEIRITEFDIGQVVAALCDVVRSLAEEKNLDLTIEVAPDLPPVSQDRGKIQQIITNLLSNAIKFTPEGGRVQVSVDRDDREMLSMRVTDTGVGIAEADRNVIFEKFRQASEAVGDDNLTRKYTGSGLGLSIVRELSTLLGGEVTFESELGTGSTFTVLLPWKTTPPPRVETTLSDRADEFTRPRAEQLLGRPTLPDQATTEVP